MVLIAHNLRSAHNVGSLLRTAEGLGIEQIYLSGYTPYPSHNNDSRLPHISSKVTKRIAKTSLGAEVSNIWTYEEDIHRLIRNLKDTGYDIVALEQTTNAKPLHSLKLSKKIALIVGREVGGVEPEIIETCDYHIFIPMYGQKDSFNVSVAAALAMYVIKLKGDGQI